MKENWKILLLEKEKLQEYETLLTKTALHKVSKSEENGYLFGLQTAQGLPAGAAAVRMEEEEMQILSVFVAEPFRRQGGAGVLLQEMIALAEQKGCRRLTAEYPFPKQWDTEIFFLAKGFQYGENGNHIFRCPIETLQAFMQEQKIPALRKGEILAHSQLSLKQRENWKRSIGKTIPTECAPEKVGGVLLPKASLAYVVDDVVQGYTVCTMIEERTAYLGLLYLDRDGGRGGQTLLYKTLSKLSQANADTFCVAAATEAGLRIIRSICKKTTLQMDEQVMHNMILPIGGTKDMLDIDFTQVGFAPLLPRLYGLQAILEELGLESSPVLSSEERPFLLLEDTAGVLHLSYLAVKPEEAGRYLLLITTELPVENPEQAERHYMNCLTCNQASAGVFAEYDEEAGKILLRFVLPEAGGMLPAEQLAFALDLFRDAVDMLRTYEKRA